MTKIAVVGAGLTGRLLSLLLAKYTQSADVKVTLFDKGTLTQPMGPGAIAAAMVSPIAESVVASDSLVAMGKASLAIWPVLLNELDLEVAFQQQGSLVLSHQQDLAHLSSFIQRLKQSSTDTVKRLNRDEISKLEPEIASTFFSGYYLPTEGQVDNKALYQETQQALEQSHVVLNLNCLIVASQTDGVLRYQNMLDDHVQQEKFDLIIDCRGLGAKGGLLKQDDKLRGVRGEVIRVRAPEVKITRPIRLMHPRYPIYLVPKPNDEFVIGATEIESQDDKPITVRSALELLSAAYSLHSGFAEAEVLSMQSGLRPTLQDNEPRIVSQDKLLQINGLYRHGYLLAPYLIIESLKLINNKFDFSLACPINNTYINTELIHELSQ